jgi:hypothetical protein
MYRGRAFDGTLPTIAPLRPVATYMDPSAAAGAPQGWEQRWSRTHHRPYYFHPHSNRSEWELPARPAAAGWRRQQPLASGAAAWHTRPLLSAEGVITWPPMQRNEAALAALGAQVGRETRGFAARQQTAAHQAHSQNALAPSLDLEPEPELRISPQLDPSPAAEPPREESSPDSSPTPPAHGQLDRGAGPPAAVTGLLDSSVLEARLSELEARLLKALGAQNSAGIAAVSGAPEPADQAAVEQADDAAGAAGMEAEQEPRLQPQPPQARAHHQPEEAQQRHGQHQQHEQYYRQGGQYQQPPPAAAQQQAPQSQVAQWTDLGAASAAGSWEAGAPPPHHHGNAAVAGGGDAEGGEGAAAPLPLPGGWGTAVSRSTGETYYVNQLTAETTYERPSAPATHEAPDPGLDGGEAQLMRAGPHPEEAWRTEHAAGQPEHDGYSDPGGGPPVHHHSDAGAHVPQEGGARPEQYHATSAVTLGDPAPNARFTVERRPDVCQAFPSFAVHCD